MNRALLVGSVNLKDAGEVFSVAARELGGAVTRLPDGETGERVAFVGSVIPALRQTPWLAEREAHLLDFAPTEEFQMPLFGIREGTDLTAVELPDLGYARNAETSFATLRELKASGAVPADTRLQVCIPSATTFAISFVPTEDQEAAIPVWERALGREVEKMVAALPADELAIQWDVPGEVGVLERFFDFWSEPDAGDLGASMARHGAFVPAGVELGFHFCYGDAPPAVGERGHHWMEPRDAATMVDLANALFAASERPIDWIHMPVPIDRDDDDYHRPLADLQLPEGTELYLGLLHDEDGVAGAERRIAAARRHRNGFGVATECGLGREPSDAVPGLMRLHRAVELG